MANRRSVLAADVDSLLGYVQEGKLFDLQQCLIAGAPTRPPEDVGGTPNLLRVAVTTGFHNIVAELLHAGGWSPAELAEALDETRSRNRDDIADLILEYTTPSPADGPSRRTQRCLAAAGIPLDKQAVLHALRTGVLTWGTPCYGRKTHLDVCAWLGISQFLPFPKHDEGDRLPFPKNGLSYRANGVLRRAGIAPEKPAVRQAIETGALFPGKRPYNYGKQTHAELCRWVGLDVEPLRRQVYLLGAAERRRAKNPPSGF